MRRSAQWYADEAAKQERQLQALVWPKGAPARQSAAEKIFPHLSKGQTVEIARREPQAAERSTPASRIYPHLSREK
jgi:hypothetical protein